MVSLALHSGHIFSSPRMSFLKHLGHIPCSWYQWRISLFSLLNKFSAQRRKRRPCLMDFCTPTANTKFFSSFLEPSLNLCSSLACRSKSWFFGRPKLFLLFYFLELSSSNSFEAASTIFRTSLGNFSKSLFCAITCLYDRMKLLLATCSLYSESVAHTNNCSGVPTALFYFRRQLVKLVSRMIYPIPYRFANDCPCFRFEHAGFYHNICILPIICPIAGANPACVSG